MAKDNLKLWSSVEKTDPDSVREISYGSRRFHAIDAHSQIKKATEVFGLFGVDWGVKDEQFDNIGNLLIYQSILFYNYEGSVGEIPVSSSIVMVDKNGRIDDECVKKVVTDGMTKALSRLGFNSDVFENKFSDSKYVQERTEEKRQQTSAKEDAENKEKIKSLVDKVIDMAKKGDINGISKVWSSNVPLQKYDQFVELVREQGNVAKKNKKDEGSTA
jgi:hypothetical protein